MFAGDLGDRIAIRELIDRYSDAVMRQDAKEYGDCWTADGEWAFRGQLIRGREEIVAFWKRAMGDFRGVMLFSQPGSMMIDNDEAQIFTHTLEHLSLPDGSVRLQSGLYQDVARCADKWRFARRSFTARELKL